ncbi:TPA: hypothetical protein ACHK0Q_005036, partial [Escherichia coli]
QPSRGEMYQPQNFLPQASKTFASAPGQLPRAVAVAAPSERSTAGRNPEAPDGRRSFAPQKMPEHTVPLFNNLTIFQRTETTQ